VKKRASKVSSDVPRSEYPRPQFQRKDWINLNGKWTYVFDFGKSGKSRDYPKRQGFDGRIVVPFCPESLLSGVGYKDFIEAMWYQRTIEIPAGWKGKRIVLNFGAVDYESEVFIDGVSVGVHYGGSSSFSHDITSHVKPGDKHNLVVYVADDARSGIQTCGKQSGLYYSHGCVYTRTTGIWQTVWLEAVAECGLDSCHIVPDLDEKRFIVTPRFNAVKTGYKFRATLREGRKIVSTVDVAAVQGVPSFVPVSKPKTWSPADPFLYDLTLEVLNEKGKTIDRVKSYAGIRKIHVDGNRLYLNNEPVYLRFVLDQGFYPDGIWTAPSDAALRRDIELSMEAGFNGARLHQKVFEERFHYWADRLGYMTWGESASWGGDINKVETARNFLSEWEEIVARDRNHPSIIAWTPFNETGGKHHTDGRQHDRLLIDVYDLTHHLDPTRPVNDTSGYYHARTDLWTIHDYQQDPEKFRENLSLREDGRPFQHKHWVMKHSEGHRGADFEPDYAGQPYLIDEYGGIKWAPEVGVDDYKKSWGYGEKPKGIDEFYERLEKLTDVLLSFDHISGYCYTQLTDVEQEQNGVYFYDRSKKFDMKRIKRIFGKTKPGYIG
jgi:beta-galactosidase/beta-glucuronidase